MAYESRMWLATWYLSPSMPLPSYQDDGHMDASKPGAPYENHIAAARSSAALVGYNPGAGVPRIGSMQ